jgi:hypothetical protein
MGGEKRRSPEEVADDARWGIHAPDIRESAEILAANQESIDKKFPVQGEPDVESKTN